LALAHAGSGAQVQHGLARLQRRQRDRVTTPQGKACYLGRQLPRLHFVQRSGLAAAIIAAITARILRLWRKGAGNPAVMFAHHVMYLLRSVGHLSPHIDERLFVLVKKP
jgi:hypothetical protein